MTSRPRAPAPAVLLRVARQVTISQHLNTYCVQRHRCRWQQRAHSERKAVVTLIARVCTAVD